MNTEPDSPAVNQQIKLGFHEKTLFLPFDKILPVKAIPSNVFKTSKYQQILTSIQTVGIIEPLVVTKEKPRSKKYILLDGHLRLAALKSVGEKLALCLIARDDEAFTYNKFVNRLSIVQEHKMIARAVEQGVPERKIAQALGVNVKRIIEKRHLLDGICPEAADLLKDTIATIGVFNLLRKMKPVRQIQAATLMNDANIYSVPYARAVWAATPKEELMDPETPKKVNGLTSDQIGRMEIEMANLDREYQIVEGNYSTDVLNFTLAKGYLKRLLENAAIVRYLAHNNAEILQQFQAITDLESLGSVSVKAAPSHL